MFIAYCSTILALVTLYGMYTTPRYAARSLNSYRQPAILKLCRQLPGVSKLSRFEEPSMLGSFKSECHRKVLLWLPVHDW